MGLSIGTLTSISLATLGVVACLTVSHSTAASVLGEDVTTRGSSDGLRSTSFGIIEMKAPKGTVTNPVDPDNPDKTNPDVDGTHNVGPLSIDYVSPLSFGKHEASNQAFTIHSTVEKPYIQVSDYTATRNGWKLEASMTPFTSGEKVLKGALLTLKDSATKTRSGNLSMSPATNEKVVLTGQGGMQSIMSANGSKGQGRGTWVQSWMGEKGNNDKVSLSVLSNTVEALTYRAVINWQLNLSPTA